jgi:hypothetical protein
MDMCGHGSSALFIEEGRMAHGGGADHMARGDTI